MDRPDGPAAGPHGRLDGSGPVPAVVPRRRRGPDIGDAAGRAGLVRSRRAARGSAARLRSDAARAPRPRSGAPARPAVQGPRRRVRRRVGHRRTAPGRLPAAPAGHPVARRDGDPVTGAHHRVHPRHREGGRLLAGRRVAVHASRPVGLPGVVLRGGVHDAGRRGRVLARARRPVPPAARRADQGPPVVADPGDVRRGRLGHGGGAGGGVDGRDGPAPFPDLPQATLDAVAGAGRSRGAVLGVPAFPAAPRRPTPRRGDGGHPRGRAAGPHQPRAPAGEGQARGAARDAARRARDLQLDRGAGRPAGPAAGVPLVRSPAGRPALDADGPPVVDPRRVPVLALPSPRCAGPRSLAPGRLRRPLPVLPAARARVGAGRAVVAGRHCRAAAPHRTVREDAWPVRPLDRHRRRPTDAPDPDPGPARRPGPPATGREDPGHGRPPPAR